MRERGREGGRDSQTDGQETEERDKKGKGEQGARQKYRVAERDVDVDRGMKKEEQERKSVL